MWGPGESRNPKFLPSVRPGTRLWGIEERWAVMDDGSDPSFNVGNEAPPHLLPLPPFLPHPQASRCAQPRGWFWLPPSLPTPQHCVLHRDKDHLSCSLQPSVCMHEPGAKKQPRAPPASFPSCLRLPSAPGYPKPLLYYRGASDWRECSLLPIHCPSPSSCGVSGLESFLSFSIWSHNCLGHQAFGSGGEGSVAVVGTLLSSLPGLMSQYPL